MSSNSNIISSNLKRKEQHMKIQLMDLIAHDTGRLGSLLRQMPIHGHENLHRNEMMRQYRKYQNSFPKKSISASFKPRKRHISAIAIANANTNANTNTNAKSKKAQ